MSSKLLLISLLSSLSLCAQASSTLRCGSALASVNDLTTEVAIKCGEPRSQDFAGYKEITDQYGFKHEVQVQEWVYGPRNGMLYFLRFEGNRLVKVDSKRGQ